MRHNIKKEAKKMSEFKHAVITSTDHAGDQIIIMAQSKFYPDTINDNDFAAYYVSNSEVIRALEHITLEQALAFARKWTDAELLSIA
jgi:hypothetical protein